VALEEVIFVAAGAVGALQAADEKDRHAHRNQDGENIFIDRKPMEQSSHIQ
jgi:hypothetical protein